MNADMLGKLQAAMDAVKGDCRVVVLTGAGDRAFSAGLDLTELDAEDEGHRTTDVSSLLFETIEAMRRHPAVFIAAVNGFALGGGLTLTHTSELAIAAEHAEFGMPEIGRGFFPALAGPATLHRILPKRASWLILTGERIDAATAERWGIVNEVVPSHLLLPRAEELAQRLAQTDAATLDSTKRALRETVTLEWSQAIDYGLNLGRAIPRRTNAARTDS